jgi:SPP1 family phage portal protein
MIGNGRKRIIDDREINESTILQILSDAFVIHKQNVADMKYLINYYKGKQDILKRPAPSTSGINNKTVLNYAYSSERDIIGYTFGKPIQIIPRTAKFRKDIKLLNDIMEYENSSTVDNEVALLAGITGVGYFYTLPSEEISSEYMPENPISINHADVFNTFVIQSAKVGHPIRLSCNYWCDKYNKKTHFTCYTDDAIYKIESDGMWTLNGILEKNKVEKEANPIGLNPIQMVQNNLFLMGDFEVAISVLNAINQLASDSLNDVENVIKSLLVVINSELDDDSINAVKKNRILELLGQPGANVDAKFIYQQLDALGAQNLREYLEEAYKVIIGIPDRKTRGGGGGDTGDAVKLRDGWADIEIVARVKESYFRMAKRKQVAVIISIMKSLDQVKKDFKVMDLDIKFSRNKTDNLQSKAQSYSTFVGTKSIAPEDALEMCDVTTDVVEVAERGKKYWDEVAEENMKKQQEMMKQSKENSNTDLPNSSNSAVSKKLGTNFTNNQNKISNKEAENNKRQKGNV